MPSLCALALRRDNNVFRTREILDRGSILGRGLSLLEDVLQRDQALRKNFHLLLHLHLSIGLPL